MNYLGIIQDELIRIERIVDEFLVLGKPQNTEYNFCHLPTILNDVVALMSAEAVMNNVEIVTDFEEVPAVQCESNRIKQAFVNIIKNAIEAMPSGGKVYLQLHQDGDMLTVDVKDEGQGIPDDRLKTIGEPFYTTKEKGTGLGLMISRKIIEGHHGSLKITSSSFAPGLSA